MVSCLFCKCGLQWRFVDVYMCFGLSTFQGSRNKNDDIAETVQDP